MVAPGWVVGGSACYVAGNVPVVRFGKYGVVGFLDACLSRCA